MDSRCRNRSVTFGDDDLMEVRDDVACRIKPAHAGLLVTIHNQAALVSCRRTEPCGEVRVHLTSQGGIQCFKRELLAICELDNNAIGRALKSLWCI